MILNYYIAGYIVRRLVSNLSCAECVGLLVGPSGVSSEHSYSESPHEFPRLVAVENRGGLYFASFEVVKLVKICEQIFREVVVNKPMSSGNVLLKL